MTRRLAAATLMASVAVVVSGCSVKVAGDPAPEAWAKNATTVWVNKYCVIQDHMTAALTIKDQATSDSGALDVQSNRVKQKTEHSQYFSAVSAATAKVITDLKNIGKAPVPEGDELVSGQLAYQMKAKQGYDNAKAIAGSLDVNDLNNFSSGIVKMEDAAKLDSSNPPKELWQFDKLESVRISAPNCLTKH